MTVRSVQLDGRLEQVHLGFCGIERRAIAVLEEFLAFRANRVALRVFGENGIRDMDHLLPAFLGEIEIAVVQFRELLAQLRDHRSDPQ